MFRVVPPTATTFGDTAGYDGGAPASPDETRKVTPACPVGVRNELSKEFSPENSPAPQLLETATTPGWRAANATAAARLERSALAASTSRIFALGAMACAHSMSSAISTAQPASGCGSDVPPVWLTLVNVGSGRPNCRSNWCRSLAARGSSYASTMAMVSPVP